MRIFSVKLIRPNGRPTIIIYPQTYCAGMKCVEYFEREYPNSTVKVLYHKDTSNAATAQLGTPVRG
jgi:hypothetical protein